VGQRSSRHLITKIVDCLGIWPNPNEARILHRLGEFVVLAQEAILVIS
jgi:hypothetical protein